MPFSLTTLSISAFNESDSSSVSRPRISKPLGPYLSCIFTSAGISARHGPHHVAHIFSRRTFPFLSAILNVEPSRFLISDSAIAVAMGGYSEGFLGASALAAADPDVSVELANCEFE